MEFRVLGPMEVWEGGRSVDVGPRMPRAVLALLLIDANRVVSLDRLIDQLWGEEPPATATTALQGYVSILRRALEPDRPARTPPRMLVTSPPGYVLRVSPEAIDAVRFEALVTEGRDLLGAGRPEAAREVLASALALWRGLPYADVGFDSFVQPEVARLSELRAGAAEARAEADLAVGGHAGAVAELERLVGEDALRERRWELYALALYRCGRQAEALRALDRARRILGEELGIDPGAALRRLEQDILVQAPSLDWRRAAPEPAPTAALPDATVPVRTDDRTASTPQRRPFVGRQPELDQLLSALAAAGRSSGRVALVAGEPGIGKTRLVEELAEHAARGDVQVAWGRCHEAEAAPAYWPWVQIIRTLVAGNDPATVRAAVGVSASELAQVVPEIKELVGGELEPLVMLEPEAARARLYDAVIGFVLRLADERPLMLVVDDLHWADVPSLQLVRLLASKLGNAAVLLTCTYREEDVGAAAPALSTLANLARVAGVVRIRPPGLGVGDVARLVAVATGKEPAAGVAETIQARTEGNPFFVSELVRLLGAERQLAGDDVVREEIPAGVRDVIRLRLARLSNEAVSLLGVAAVIGRKFELDHLVAAADVDEERTLELLEAGLLIGVVVEDDAAVGRFRFSHALVHETVYEGLSSVRGPRLHRRVAGVLQHAGGGDATRVLEIAHHLYAGAALGGADEAFDWAMRAGEAAIARLAFEQAEEEFRRAIELLARMRRAPDVARRELAAQVQLGALLFMTRGYSEPAVGHAWSRARELCQDVPDAPELLPALWGLWAFTCVRAEFETALGLAGQLLEHGRRTGNTLFQVIGHETMGITCWHQGRLAESREHLAEGARLCDGLPAELFTGVLLEKHPGVACRSFAGVVLWLLGEESRAIEVADEGVDLARRLAHPFSTVVALFFGAWLRVLLRDRESVIARADEGIALARQHGFRQFVAMLTILRGWATDDVGSMQQGLDEFLDTGSRMLQHFFLGLMADVQVRAGRRDEALTTVERARAEGAAVGERFWEAELHRLRAELLSGGDDAEASLRQAIAVARAQGARSLEARAAGDLARR